MSSSWGWNSFRSHCLIPPRRFGLCSFVSAAMNESVPVLLLALMPSSSVWAASALLLSLHSSQTYPSRLKSFLKEIVKLHLFTFSFGNNRGRRSAGWKDALGKVWSLLPRLHQELHFSSMITEMKGSTAGASCDWSRSRKASDSGTFQAPPTSSISDLVVRLVLQVLRSSWPSWMAGVKFAAWRSSAFGRRPH